MQTKQTKQLLDCVGYKCNLKNKLFYKYIMSQKIIKLDDIPGWDEETLPDLNKLTREIINLLTFLNTPEMKKLKIEDFQKYESTAEKECSYVPTYYYGIFQKIINGKDISYLLEMLVELNKVKENKASIKEVAKGLGEKLAEQYIYPNLKSKKR